MSEERPRYLPRGVDEKHRMELAAAVKLVVFDVDGTLTDGRLGYGDLGQRLIFFFSSDGHGIAELVRQGLEVAFVTANAHPGVRERADRLGVQHVLLRAADKVAAVEMVLADLGLSWEQVCYVGDDVNDVPAMRKAGLAIAVGSATAPCRDAAHWQSNLPGGQGAAREACDLLLLARGFTWTGRGEGHD